MSEVWLDIFQFRPDPSLSSLSMDHVEGLVLPDDVGANDALTYHEGMDTLPAPVEDMGTLPEEEDAMVTLPDDVDHTDILPDCWMDMDDKDDMQPRMSPGMTHPETVEVLQVPHLFRPKEGRAASSV